MKDLWVSRRAAHPGGGEVKCIRHANGSPRDRPRDSRASPFGQRFHHRSADATPWRLRYVSHREHDAPPIEPHDHAAVEPSAVVATRASATRTSLALCVAVTLCAARASAQAPGTSDALHAATALFNAGVTHLDARRFADAADAFERSLALHETSAAAYDLALARRALGDPLRALAAFQRFLARARADHPNRARAEAAVSALRRQLAHVLISVDDTDAELRVDGEVVALSEGLHERDLTAGAHVFEARWRGGAPVRVEATLERGETLTIPMLRPAEPARAARTAPAQARPRTPHPPQRRTTTRSTWFWVGVGVGAAVLVAAVTALVVTSLNTPSDYDRGRWNTVVQGATQER